MIKSVKKNKNKEPLKKIFDDFKIDLRKIKDEQKIIILKNQINSTNKI